MTKQIILNLALISVSTSALVGALGLTIIYFYICYIFVGSSGWRPSGLLGIAQPPYLWLALGSSATVSIVGWCGSRLARFARDATGQANPRRSALSSIAARMSSFATLAGGAYFVMTCGLWLSSALKRLLEA